MYICLSCFSGSTRFNNWIKTHIVKNATVSLKNNIIPAMEKIIKTGPRKMPPGKIELQAKMVHFFFLL